MAGEIENKIKEGVITATIWKNTSNEGKPFNTVSLQKSYQKDGEWHNTNTLGSYDLDNAMTVLQRTKDYLSGLQK